MFTIKNKTLFSNIPLSFAKFSTFEKFPLELCLYRKIIIIKIIILVSQCFLDASSLLLNIDHLIKSNEPSKMSCTLKESSSYISTEHHFSFSTLKVVIDGLKPDKAFFIILFLFVVYPQLILAVPLKINK